MPRYLSEVKRSRHGHVTAQFVDDNLKRRTIAVPFSRSTAEDMDELVEWVANNVQLLPKGMDNGR